MTIQPYHIVPKLIPQPTWGGDYIARYKGIDYTAISEMKIGQSFELCSSTMLTVETDPTKIPLEIADPKTGKTIDVIGDRHAMFSLQELIDQDPEAVLGDSYLEKYGASMQILIKFTQAKGNSFQVHFRPSDAKGHWKPKPESWYFLEPGKATLGIRPTTDISEYKRVCQEIAAAMQDVSHAVKAGSLPISTARMQIQGLLTTKDPYQFVNTTEVPAGAVIDLSAGGIHHSWEEGDSIPQGNIVYEVQAEVMDDDCTLRSFDKGKIGEDGSLRPVHIDDYFTALVTDPDSNDLASLIGNTDGTTIFSTPFYETLRNSDAGSLDTMLGKKSFIHRFPIVDDGQKGWSLFIPWSSR